MARRRQPIAWRREVTLRVVSFVAGCVGAIGFYAAGAPALLVWGFAAVAFMSLVMLVLRRRVRQGFSDQ